MKSYRKDIDGLRAISVISVILFHSEIILFQGGFVGVDIFFVISGFLITKIIISEIFKKKFKLINFYKRRIKRLLPALLTVILSSILIFWIIFLPTYYKDFLQSSFFSIIFLSNFLFYVEAGDYWAVSKFKPLLHTWSLSIEEQFYLFYPILILLLIKVSFKLTKIVIFILFSISLIICVINEDNSLNFYLTHIRLWELLLGGLINFLNIKYLPNLKNLIIYNLLTISGLILILISIFLFDNQINYPGLHTLAPTIGAALIIIFSNKNTIIYHLLSNKILVFTGLISYSLYLWHLPVLVFFNAYLNEPINNYQLLLCLFIIFLLSLFTWQFIEKPIRFNSKINFNILSSSLFIISISILVFSYFGHISKGYSYRFYTENEISYNDWSNAYNDNIYYLDKDKFTSTNKIKIIVYGNSYSRDFVNILKETYNVNDIEIIYKEIPNLCINVSDKYKKINNQANLIFYASGIFSKICINKYIKNINSYEKNIYFVGPKDFGRNLNWIMRVDKKNRKLNLNQINQEILEIDKKNKSFIPDENYISLLDFLMLENGKIYFTDINGFLLTTDGSHLTRQGAKFIGNKIINRLNKILNIKNSNKSHF